MYCYICRWWAIDYSYAKSATSLATSSFFGPLASVLFEVGQLLRYAVRLMAFMASGKKSTNDWNLYCGLVLLICCFVVRRWWRDDGTMSRSHIPRLSTSRLSILFLRYNLMKLSMMIRGPVHRALIVGLPAASA
jgi:hypothetical protein